MKKQRSHIAIFYLLIGCLSFGQLGISGFHGAHKEHRAQVKLSDPVSLVEHGEHCIVCAIDLNNHAFDFASFVFESFLFYLPGKSLESQPLSRLTQNLSQGRAPPVLLLH